MVLLIIHQMQVDSRNYPTLFPKILEAIESSSFISFDCEFTGLTTYPCQMESAYPNQNEFYQRIKETAYNFSLLQIGLTTFHWNNGKKKYIATAYNFYLRPDGDGGEGAGWNNVIGSQVDSLTFLARNGMDFKRVFQYGIPCGRLEGKSAQKKEQERQLNEMMAVKKLGVVYSPTHLKEIGQIQSFLLGSELSENRIDFKSKTVLNYFKDKYQKEEQRWMIFDRPRKNLKVQYKPNEYVVRLYENKKQKQEKKEEIKESSQKEQCKIDALLEKQKIKIEQNHEAKWEENIVFQAPITTKPVQSLNKFQQVDQIKLPLHESVTFERLFQAIIQRRIPIIGYYCSLDLGLIYHNLIAPMPSTFQEFSHHLCEYFPIIIDLKTLGDRLGTGSMRNAKMKWNLKGMYDACRFGKILECSVELKEMGGYENEAGHQAGWDSYMTGVAFVGLAEMLLGNAQIDFSRGEWMGIRQMLHSKHTGQVSLLAPFTNLDYDSTILIHPLPAKQIQNFLDLQTILSKYSSFQVSEFLDQTFFHFDQPIDVQTILYMYPGMKLKRYQERKILLARRRGGMH